MIDFMPKITDISSLKGMSMLLAPPMLCIAYILQSGLQVSFQEHIFIGLNTSENENWHMLKFIMIFILKSVLVIFFAHAINTLLEYIHIFSSFPWLYIVSVLFIAFALFGIFAKDSIPELSMISQFWYYAFIVWGIAIQTIQETIDQKEEKI